jgi:hypothetical protein
MGRGEMGRHCPCMAIKSVFAMYSFNFVLTGNNLYDVLSIFYFFFNILYLTGLEGATV